jgi:hypothetical protein
MIVLLYKQYTFFPSKTLFFIPRNTTEIQYVEVMGKDAPDKIAFYASRFR